MRKLIITAALLIFSSVAMAQTGGSGTGSSTSSASQPRLPREAPIGHRQPRADEVPSEKSLSDPNNPMNKEDAALDRKIKSICRGC
jgi:hypothetical protein